MTRLDKLREQLEEANCLVKDAFAQYDRVIASKKDNMTVIETSDHVLELVKAVVQMTENMAKALGAFSTYTAALEKKLGQVPKRKHDTKRKKASL